MKDKNISKILREIEVGYDQMADKFSGTRSFFWPDLEFIKDHISDGDRVLDFGCGNGRLLEILKDKKTEYYGADVSQKLLDLAKEKYPQFRHNFVKISGQSSLPVESMDCSDSTKQGYANKDNSQYRGQGLSFPDNFFNAIVSIAVFHHFPDEKFRLEMAKELYRITKPGGEIIVTVWNLWQPKYRKYIWKNIGKKIIGRSDLDFLDCAIPFKNNAGESFARFHHAYTVKKLAKLFVDAGFSVSEARVVNNKNLVVIAKKI